MLSGLLIVYEIMLIGIPQSNKNLIYSILTAVVIELIVIYFKRCVTRYKGEFWPCIDLILGHWFVWAIFTLARI